MIAGNWKAVRLGFGDGVPIELYDLSKDIGEQSNVAEKHPEVVAKMKEIFSKAHVDSPDWKVPVKQAGGAAQGKKKAKQ